MLFIHTNIVPERQWSVGQPKPEIPSFETLQNIVVDGSELEYVYGMFSNGTTYTTTYDGTTPIEVATPIRPPFIPKGDKVTLFGDLAKTIIANLNNL